MNEFRQIKASAGSGKTYTLTGSFLSLLAGASGSSWKKGHSGCALPEGDGSYGWQEILAITFTNKAAAEMRERVLSRLKDHALAPAERRRSGSEEKFWTPPRAKAAVDALIRSYSQLNIRTIDSLLHLMVRLCSLDFDLSPDFEPRFSENDISGPIFDLMAEQARDGDEELAALFRRACEQLLHSENMSGFLAGDRIRNRVTGMVSLLLNADGWSLNDLATPAEAEAHLRSMLSGIESRTRELLQRITDENLSANKRFLNALSACTECGGSASRLPDSAYFKKESIDDCLNKASKGMASLTVHALYDGLRDDLNEMRILIKARRLMPFAELAHAVFSRLEAYERRSGTIAASQIPRLAIRAADDSEGVNSLFCRMGSRISHILIDEFQDTSRDQWFALLPLAEEALSKGGSLTIVGDVKQAIYGWRGGDAALFDKLVSPGSSLIELVEKSSLETLPCNWRSRERIVAWNNALFSPIGDGPTASSLLRELAEGNAALLEEQAGLLRDAFDRASQSAEHCRPGGFVQLHWQDKGQEQAALLEQLPELVESLGRSHSWGDICILTRSNDQASLAASWLMARHIPVVTQGSLLLAEQPAVAELVSLLRFLNTPEDDLAFWSTLSGEHLLPTLHDAEGVPLTLPRLTDWAASRPRLHTLARQFASDFPEAWESVFAPLHEGAGLLTPYDSAMEVLQRWDVITRLPEAEGFLLRFLEVLFSIEEQGISDLSGFLDWWDENGGKEKAPLPESMDAVRIMTMHKAKGLEFDVVILPWMDFPLGRTTDDKAVFWNSRGTGLLAPLCREMGEPWLRHRMDTAREALHLAYVAMTRAVSELYCFLPDPDSGSVPAMLDELISRLRPQMTEHGQTVVWGEIPAREESESPEAGFSPAGPPPASSLPKAFPLAFSASAENQEEHWSPMGWLPRLRMFRSPLDDWTFTARRRGTLIHHCLECLQVSGKGEASARRDAELAAARGLSTFPLPVPDKEAALKDITEDLAWYASLPETPHWLAFGTPEHALLDSEGRQSRVDLLVNDGHELTAVEYKTGTSGPLPAQAHVEQLSRYLRLLKDASGLPVRGVLVYLDRRVLIPLETENGASHV
ncbi:UvrD-helicase domain-containing protein [Mailhella sp.]